MVPERVVLAVAAVVVFLLGCSNTTTKIVYGDTNCGAEDGCSLSCDAVSCANDCECNGGGCGEVVGADCAPCGDVSCGDSCSADVVCGPDVGPEDLAGDVWDVWVEDGGYDLAGDGWWDVWVEDGGYDLSGDGWWDVWVEDVTGDGWWDVGEDWGGDWVWYDVMEDVEYCDLGEGKICCVEDSDCTGKLLDDGEAPCTPAICRKGQCVVGLVTCLADGECEVDGECDEQTGLCDDMDLPNGTICSAGVCVNGTCVNLCGWVSCEALDECHVVGECDSATGLCSNPPAPDGIDCPGGVCKEGLCVSLCAEVVCPVPAACRLQGACDEATGLCSTPVSADGSLCEGGKCFGGVCKDQCETVVCPDGDECNLPGVCNSQTGLCSEEKAPDYTVCSSGVCLSGLCVDLCDGVVCPDTDECTVSKCDRHTGQCEVIGLDGSEICSNGRCEAGVCVDQCIGVVCAEPDECHQTGVCDPISGVCDWAAKANGTECSGGICLDGVCSDLCEGVTCSLPGQCQVGGECNPATGLCSFETVADGQACDWGKCYSGHCVGLADPVFQTTNLWSKVEMASVSTTVPGYGNSGVGIIAASTGKLFQNVTVPSQDIPLRLSVDALGFCQSGSSFDCMVYPAPEAMFAAGGVNVLRFVPRQSIWTSVSSCVGETGYGDSVEYSLTQGSALMVLWTFHFDNAKLEVVDNQTCPLVGQVLNGDMAGDFGWQACQGTGSIVTYQQDGEVRYVNAAANGSCGGVTCLTTWLSVPTTQTMPHSAVKFSYKTAGPSSGGYNFIVQSNNGLEYLNYDSTTWKDVVMCTPTGARGLAQELRFSRGACGAGQNDYVSLKNVRIEDDPVACP